MAAKNLMVVGTASSAGKSLLVTAFCRIFKRRGLRVAPFKSQNMSLNSFVTAEGHEMGRAQVAQAEAAGLLPSSLMNPILLKPTADSKSQVIVNGRVYGNMTAAEYYACKDKFRPLVSEAYRKLAEGSDAVFIEGAGSPAEINLMENDFVNMGLAAMLDAPVVLVGDIDRGGVFASLYGTVKLLPPEDQARFRGLIVNKFRGDIKILEPGLARLEELLNIPVLATLPYGRFAIDEEDSLSERLAPAPSGGQPASINIAVPRLPRLAIFTDFAVFDAMPGVALRYADEPSQLDEADLIILPGSKNTIEDMLYLTQTGFADKLKKLAAQGRVIVGICGGFQMLGRAIHDPLALESSAKSIAGLGLLDIETTFAAEKHTRQSSLALASSLPGPLAALGGFVIDGYEIHHGETPVGPGLTRLFAQGELGAANEAGNVFGSYLHGFFDNMRFTAEFLNQLRRAKGLPALESSGLPASYAAFKEKEYDRLADMVEERLPFEKIKEIMR